MKHPYNLPNIDIIVDMFLELQDSEKFDLINLDLSDYYNKYDVKVCDIIDYNKNKLYYSEFMANTFEPVFNLRVQTKTFKIHQKLKRVVIGIGKYWFTESNYLDDEKINIANKFNTGTKKISIPVVPSYENYAEIVYDIIRNDIDLLDVIERVKDYLGDDLIQISNVSREKLFIIDFNSYNYEIIKIE